MQVCRDDLDVRLKPRQWLIVALGAGIPIPYALHLPADSSSYVALDIVIWPLIVGALLLTGKVELRRLLRDPVTRLVIAYMIVSAISLPIGVITYHRISGLISFVYEVLLLVNIPVGYWVLRDLDDIDLLLRAFVASISTVASVFAVYLLYVGALVNAHRIHNSQMLMASVYGWPNGFSVLLAVGFLMCMYVIPGMSSRIARSIYTVLAIALVANLFLTFSKTGWVVLLIALWVRFFRFWIFRRQLLLLSALASTVVSLSVINETFHLQVLSIGSLIERIQFLVVVLHDLNPMTFLLGSGSQSVGTVLASHARDQLIPGETVGQILSTHDEFLNVLIKSGIAALALFVSILVVVVARFRKLSFSHDDHTMRLFRYWYPASLAVIASAFVGEQLHYWLVSALFWMMAGATIRLLPVSDPQRAVVVTSRPGHPVKRALDLTVGSVALVVTSPVLLVASIFVKLDSPGPAFYRGDRVGRGGWIFPMYKLRTMRVGAEGGGSVTAAGDPRVTRVGRVLRKLKLDELPQLINVVSGDMSLVGPRPDTAEYARLYNERQRDVLSVRPGLTSPASIAFQNEEELLRAAAADGGRSPAEIYREVIMPKELELDLEYVAHWSVRRDLKILAQTAGLVLRRLLGLPGELRHPGGGRLAPPQAEVDQPLQETDAITDVVADEGGRQDR
jgi:lipopolysaccharide/colanic/teichoic acid biosynthesis glycosyltransferase